MNNFSFSRNIEWLKLRFTKSFLITQQNAYVRNKVQNYIYNVISTMVSYRFGKKGKEIFSLNGRILRAFLFILYMFSANTPLLRVSRGSWGFKGSPVSGRMSRRGHSLSPQNPGRGYREGSVLGVTEEGEWVGESKRCREDPLQLM